MHPFAHDRDLSGPQRLYVWLTGACVACLIIADMIGNKLFRFELPFSIPLPWGEPITGIEHSSGMLTFPVTFILTDLINEYFGPRNARRTTYVALAGGVLAFAAINAAQAMPYLDQPFNVAREHFDGVFGTAKVMFVASLAAYVVGQVCDILLFGVMKRLTGGRMIWLRATGSTVVSQFVDSFVVTFLGLHLLRKLTHAQPDSVVPLASVLPIAVTGYLLKFVLALAVTPLIYLGHGLIRRWGGIEPLPAQPRE
jgi:queuosine precursor transporter